MDFECMIMMSHSLDIVLTYFKVHVSLSMCNSNNLNCGISQILLVFDVIIVLLDRYFEEKTLTVLVPTIRLEPLNYLFLCMHHLLTTSNIIVTYQGDQSNMTLVECNVTMTYSVFQTIGQSIYS